MDREPPMKKEASYNVKETRTRTQRLQNAVTKLSDLVESQADEAEQIIQDLDADTEEGK